MGRVQKGPFGGVGTGISVKMDNGRMVELIVLRPMSHRLVRVWVELEMVKSKYGMLVDFSMRRRRAWGFSPCM